MSCWEGRWVLLLGATAIRQSRAPQDASCSSETGPAGAGTGGVRTQGTGWGWGHGEREGPGQRSLQNPRARHQLAQGHGMWPVGPRVSEHVPWDTGGGCAPF